MKRIGKILALLALVASTAHAAIVQQNGMYTAPLTGAVLRTNQSKFSDVPSVADFGASPTTGTVANAVTAVQSAGGSLLFPNGGYSGVTLPTNFSNVALDYYGPNTPVNVYDNLGTTATGQSYRTFRSADHTAHTGLENYGVMVDAHPFGSGDGTVPGTDYALGVSAIKQGWSASPQAGQVVGMNIVTRSSYTGAFVSPSYSPGDTSGIIVNTVQASTNSYTAVLEGFSAYYLGGNVSASDAQAMDVQLGPIRKDQNIAEGFVVTGSQGALDNGLLVQNSGTSTFAHVMTYNSASGKTFDMPISGGVPRIRLYDGTGGIKSLRVLSNVFSILNTAESAQILTLNDTGQLGVTGNITAASVDTTPIGLNQAASGRFTTLEHGQQEKDSSFSAVVPTSGSTVVIPDTSDTIILAPSGALAALTVRLPTCNSGNNGGLARYSTTLAITALTVTATAGTVANAPSTLAAGSGNQYICSGGSALWYRLY